MKKLSALLIVSLAGLSEAVAQGCAVCTKTAEGFGASAASSLNTGILYLAAIPVGFMGTMAYLWIKRSRQK